MSYGHWNCLQRARRQSCPWPDTITCVPETKEQLKCLLCVLDHGGQLHYRALVEAAESFIFGRFPFARLRILFRRCQDAVAQMTFLAMMEDIRIEVACYRGRGREWYRCVDLAVSSDFQIPLGCQATCKIFIKRMVVAVLDRVVRKQAVAVIWRGWLEAISNPNRQMCRRRLVEEFAGLTHQLRQN